MCWPHQIFYFPVYKVEGKYCFQSGNFFFQQPLRNVDINQLKLVRKSPIFPH
ncbi:hypothetical protein O3M35_002285 [Rhynocoris fuscipes]|uniref:Uncharacterized protein n=1 Tax=Rhynocoris fuscipes TaxID=488301 RepID=A0AAW1CJR8_9HEMI